MPSLDELKKKMAESKTEPEIQVEENNNTVKISSTSPAFIVGAKGEQIKIEDLTEADILKYASIEARPLGAFDALDITPVRKEYAYRWVNKHNNQNYQRALSLGFEPASPNDVQLKDKSLVRDGVITLHDVVLMKMPKLQYFGYLKNNVKRAINTVKRTNLGEIGVREGQKTISEIHAPASYDISKKVGFYNPPIGDLNK